MPKYFKAPIGTYDYLPEKYRYFRFIRQIIHRRFDQCGFGKISTPLFEEAKSFERSIGKDSEIIQKELYQFEDRHERKFTLRPEITTSVVRAFIQHEMYETEDLPVQLFYMGNCFRFERIKSNTQRSFWQFGAEILGMSDPAIDAQLMYLAHRILTDLKIEKFCELKINTIGSSEDRKKYIDALENFYAGKERSLTPTSQEKFKQKKFIALLTPLSEDEEILVKMAPKMTDFLSKESKQFFDDTLEYLDLFGVEYSIDSQLFRPLEYYNHTVFEFREKGTGHKIMAGGRYDGLISKMGGPELGGSGFAAGVERLIHFMEQVDNIDLSQKNHLQVFVATTGPVAKKHALPLLIRLREHGFYAVGNLGKVPMEELLKRAEKIGAPYSVLIGDLEVRKGIVLVRDMKTGKKEEVKIENVIKHLDKLIKPDKQLQSK